MIPRNVVAIVSIIVQKTISHCESKLWLKNVYLQNLYKTGIIIAINSSKISNFMILFFI